MPYIPVDLRDLLDVDDAVTPVKGRMLVGNGTSWTVIEPGNEDDVLTVTSATDDIGWAPPATGGGGGGGSVAVDDDGVEVTPTATRLNFGTSLDVTDNGGGSVTIDVPGGGSGGGGGSSYATSPADKPPATAHADDDEFDDTTIDASWTWVNQGSRTASESNGRLEIVGSSAAGYNVSALVKPTPATPWTATTKIGVSGPWTNHGGGGILVRDASSGRHLSVSLHIHAGAPNIEIQRANSPTSFSAAPATLSGLDPSVMHYLRIRDDGTTLFVDLSPDGLTWQTIYSEARATFVAAPSHVGLFVNQEHGGNNVKTTAHWFRVNWTPDFDPAADGGGGGGGGGGLTWATPLAASNGPGGADDDEFDNATNDLTVVAPNTGTAVWTEGKDVLSCRFSAINGGDVGAALRARTFTVGDVMEVPVRLLTRNSQFPSAGIVLTDGTGLAATAIGMFILTEGGGVRLNVRHGTVDGLSLIHTEQGADQSLGPSPLFLRLIYQAANTFRFRWSPDGVSWTDLGMADLSKTMTPTHGGPMVTGFAAAQPEAIATFDYLRFNP